MQRSRALPILVVIVIAALVGLKALVANASQEVPSPLPPTVKESNRPDLPMAQLKPTIPPSGNWTPKLKRLQSEAGRLMDMNDHGDFLYCETSSTDYYQDYLFVSNGKPQKLEHNAHDTTLLLTENGGLIKRLPIYTANGSIGARGGSSGATSIFTQGNFIRTTSENGSTLNISAEGPPPYKLTDNEYSGPSTTLYEAPGPITLLERDKDRIWLRQTPKLGSIDQDKLILIENGKAKSLNFPSSYGSVSRVAATGKYVVATFGRYLGKEPFRSYRWDGKNWKELPLPEGYQNSHVQKVFFDGVVIGLITDQASKEYRQVAWKGDSIAFLDNLPGWPQSNHPLFIDRATRNGTLCLKDAHSFSTPSNEIYLLSLKS